MNNVSTAYYPDGVGTVHTIHHPTCPVEVWHDGGIPDAPVVALEVGFPGKVGHDPVFVPVEVARQVAAAILASVPK